MIESEFLTDENFLTHILQFRDRQAGISVIYNPENESYTYNAYAVEAKVLTELWSEEHEDLDLAIKAVNQEFGSWELTSLGEKDSAGCGTCTAH